jgi:hypothetical protein
MKTIQEKIAELEIRTSNLEKKSSFEGKKHLDEIAQWIESQPGVQIIKRKHGLSKDIDWLLTKYRAVSLTDYYHVYSASNKANTLVIDFTRNPNKGNFVRLTYSKTTGDIEILRKRISNKPRGGVVNKTPKEVADLLYSGEGIEAWDKLLTRGWDLNLENSVHKEHYSSQFFKIMVQRLRKKKNPDLPSRMSTGFKQKVIEILVDTLPNAMEDGEFIYSK